MWSLLASLAFAFPSHDEPLRTGVKAPGDAAVVIGIEDYFALPDVPYAGRDAQAVEDLFIYTMGVPADRVQRLTANASKEAIEAALTNAVGQVGANGTLWVYFAGHGAASPSTGDRLLLGIDTMSDAVSFEARSVSVPWVQEATAGVPRTVLMVDACYAGAGRGGTELLAGKRFAVPSYVAAPTTSFVEWHAAQPNELSGPLDVAEHGAFTWAMVGALRGWADGQVDGTADGVVTLEEADLYAAEVLRTVEVRDQVPSLLGSERTSALIRLPADRGEARPDSALLRSLAKEVPPAAPPPVAAHAAPSGSAPRWLGTCTPEAMAPEALTGRYAWMAEPGTDPRATWSCVASAREWSGGVTLTTSINRFPPVPGKSVEDAVVDNLTVEASRVPGKVPKITMAMMMGKHGDRKTTSLDDPSSWPTATVSTPRGDLTAWMVPVARQRSTGTAAGPYFAVQDDREPGAFLVCQSSKPGFNSRTCVTALEAVLRSDIIDPGIVR